MSSKNKERFQSPPDLSRETLHKLLSEAVTDGCWAYYPETGHVFWDEGIRKNFGLADGVQLSFDDYMARVHPKDQDDFLNTVSELRNVGDRFITEHRFVVLGHGYKWLRGEAVLQKDDEGRLVLIGFVRLLEKAIRFNQHAQRKLELLEISEEIGKTGHFIWSSEQNLVVVSDGLKRLYGDKLEEFSLQSSTHLEKFHGTQAQELVAAAERLMLGTNKQIETIQVSMIRGGESIVLRYRMRLSDNPRTGDQEIIGAVVDVTGEVDLSERLKLSEIRTLSILKHLQGDVYQIKVGKEGESAYTYVGPRIAGILELDSAEDLEQIWKLKEFIPDEDKSNFIRSIEYAVSNEEDWYYTGRLVTAKGNLKNFIAHSDLTKEGDDLIYNGFILDMTESSFNTELLRKVESVTKTGTWQVDMASQKVHWSDEVYRIHGLEIGADIDVSIGVNFYKEGRSRNRIKEVVDRLIKNNVPYDERLQIIAADGKEKWVRTQGFAETADGKCIRAYGTFQDITDQMEEVHAHKALEEQVSTIASYTNYHLWWIQPDGVVKYINKEPLNYLGVSKEEAAQIDWSDYLHPNDLEGVAQITNDAIKRKASYTVQYRAKRYDGVYQWFRVMATSIYSESGEFTGWSGISINIDKEMRTQEELQRYTRMLNATLEATGASVWDISLDDRNVHISPTWFAALGYQAREESNLSIDEFKELIHPDDLSTATAAYTQLSFSNPEVNLVVRYRTSTESFVWYVMKGRVHEWNLDGSPKKVLGIALPFDEVIEKENRLIELNQELTERSERLELTNQDLIEAKEEADKLNAMKSEFLSRVSHELRTPLTAILGETELLMDRVEDEQHIQDLRLIESSAKVLQNIVSDLLDLTVVQNPGFSLTEEVFDVNQLMETTEKMGRFRIMELDKSDDVALRVNRPFVPHMVKADSVRVQQILNNLLDNAIKYTEQGFVELSFEIKDHENETFLEYTVKDTGIGFSTEMVEIIQQPFTQLNASKLQTGGVGLGLSICKSLLKAMNGGLDISSTQGEGACFTATIPLKKAAQQLDQASETTEKYVMLDKPRILVAEDNAINQHVISAQLERLNIDFDLVGDGAECVELLHKEEFDLVLMDLMMPVMDGYDATREILSSKAIKKKPYITAFTANANRSDKEACQNAGMHDFLSKPVTLEDIRTLIIRWQGRQP